MGDACGLCAEVTPDTFGAEECLDAEATANRRTGLSAGKTGGGYKGEGTGRRKPGRIPCVPVCLPARGDGGGFTDGNWTGVVAFDGECVHTNCGGRAA